MDNQKSGEEKRKFKRVNASFTVIYQVEKPVVVKLFVGWGREVEALMVDLSEGGMALISSYDIPAGTIFNIKFTLINLALSGAGRIRTMKILGKVCYAVPLRKGESRLGINFEEITADDRLAIASFVSRN